jgi:crotonobetainyl-CoA:carnitine CoA-transferase CaiB-like acyl-CoA transferase
MADIRKPLEAIRVIELTTYLAGPTCGRILADMGAEVIKIESFKGDPYRRQGELYAIPTLNTNNPLFVAANAGKKFVVIDLKNAEGLEVFYKLIKNADVFITNLMDRSLTKLKATYEDLKSVNPRLVYGIIDGYGPRGPAAGRPGFDATAYFARGGHMLDYVQKGNPPNNMMLGAGDCNTGLSLAAGVLAALVGARRHGQGNKVCSSLLHTSIWMASMNYVISQYGKNYFIDRCYRCKDGVYMYVQAITEKQKDLLCEIIGVDKKAYDDRWNAVPKLRALYETKTFAEWSEMFSNTNICVERLKHIEEVPQDEQARVNHFLMDYEGDSEQCVSIPVSPIKNDFKDEEPSCAISQGGDTESVLDGLGFSAEEIARLAENRAVGLSSKY